MGKVTLYQIPLSSPCRAVQMLADVIGLDVDVKLCDLFKGEHLKPEFLKINPHHTVPTMVDEDGFVLNQSRAIMTYLVSKYAPNSSLYPADLKKRAKIDEALQFDGTTLYPWMGVVVYPVIKSMAPLDLKMTQMLDNNLVLLNEDLGRTPYIAGDELTIADLSMLATWTSIEAIGLWKLDDLINVHAWVKRIKDSGKIKNWEEIVVKHAKLYGDFIKQKIEA